MIGGLGPNGRGVPSSGKGSFIKSSTPPPPPPPPPETEGNSRECRAANTATRNTAATQSKKQRQNCYCETFGFNVIIVRHVKKKTTELSGSPSPPDKFRIRFRNIRFGNIVSFYRSVSRRVAPTSRFVFDCVVRKT